MCCAIEDITPEEEEVGIFRIFLDDRLKKMLITELFFEFSWELSEVTDDLTSILDLKVTLQSE